MTKRSTAGAVAVIAALAITGTGLPASAAPLPTAGDEIITLSVGDDLAGGSYELQFEKVYDQAADADTDVLLYAPVGWDVNGGAGVVGLDPSADPNPDDTFVPCGGDAAVHSLTQEKIDALGDELATHVVPVDEAHFGEIGDAGQSGEDLVTLLYNVFDDAFYDCEAGSYTAGYFAPQFIDDYQMNTIVIDTNEFTTMTGNPDTSTDLTNEGVIAHELEHLIHSYSDAGEISWVDEGLADFAIFLNGYPVGGSHVTYSQVFHRETSLTRWAGGLENYGAAYTFFQYLWERAGGNGTAAGDQQFRPDGTYSATAGDLLIKTIFAEQGDGMAGVANAITTYNATNGTAADVPSVEQLFKDWSLAVYLDDETDSIYDIKSVDIGSIDSQGWTIDIANDEFYGKRGQYTGATPEGRFAHSPKVPAQNALPFGASYETFRNPGKTFSVDFTGPETVQVVPHTGDAHWYGGATSQSDNILDVSTAVTGGETLDFWTWYFIEEGWDYGFVEALVDGVWTTVPVTEVGGGEITTDENPQGANDEGNGITGTSGGAYFVDEPEYIHVQSTLPAGATDVRFRYSTDAAYLDTGWFIDDVLIDGTAADVASGSGWKLSDGAQYNDWSVQVVSTCDLTPGATIAGETTEPGRWVYQLSGSSIHQRFTQCSTKESFTVVISNLTSGDIDSLDAPYTFRVNKVR